MSQFDVYPMPHVDYLLNELGQAVYLSMLHLTKGYSQIPIAPSDKEKTIFPTTKGLFHFFKMPFGPHRTTATFQQLMDRVLAAIKGFTAT